MPFRITSWLRYLLHAKGPHGVHSPFVFDFVNEVLRGGIHPHDREIESLRRALSRSKEAIRYPDYGAGSANRKSGESQRTVGEIASRSARRLRSGALLGRIVRRYRPSIMLELGTNLGISGLYLLRANPSAQLITLEGAEALAKRARENFERMNLHPEILTGEFASTLPKVLSRAGLSIDLAFIDGNHRKAPTLDYLHQILPHCREGSVIILDDIHWSQEMEEAWREIQAIPDCTLTIDLFQFGIVFPFRKQAKEEFVLKA